jgi:hypothetical protein
MMAMVVLGNECAQRLRDATGAQLSRDLAARVSSPRADSARKIVAHQTRRVRSLRRCAGVPVHPASRRRYRSGRTGRGNLHRNRSFRKLQERSARRFAVPRRRDHVIERIKEMRAERQR